MNAVQETTEVLLQRARAGDRDVLDRLLSLYRQYLHLVARTQIDSQLRVRLDASDLVQETLLAAYTAFPDFRGGTEHELVAWLRKILVRVLADQVKRHQAWKRDLRREQSLEAALEQSSQAMDVSLAAAASSPSAQAAQRELSVVVAEALARLPDDYQEVIILRELERKSFAEAADHMQRSSGAIRMLWARALERLRSELQGKGI